MSHDEDQAMRADMLSELDKLAGAVRNGTVRSIAFVTTLRDDEGRSGHIVRLSDIHEVVGLLEAAKADLLAMSRREAENSGGRRDH